jgi:hypothetical protein
VRNTNSEKIGRVGEMQAGWELIRASAPGLVEHFRARRQRPDRQHHGNAGQRVRSIS